MFKYFKKKHDKTLDEHFVELHKKINFIETNLLGRLGDLERYMAGIKAPNTMLSTQMLRGKVDEIERELKAVQSLNGTKDQPVDANKETKLKTFKATGKYQPPPEDENYIAHIGIYDTQTKTSSSQQIPFSIKSKKAKDSLKERILGMPIEKFLGRCIFGNMIMNSLKTHLGTNPTIETLLTTKWATLRDLPHFRWQTMCKIYNFFYDDYNIDIEDSAIIERWNNKYYTTTEYDWKGLADKLGVKE